MTGASLAVQQPDQYGAQNAPDIRLPGLLAGRLVVDAFGIPGRHIAAVAERIAVDIGTARAPCRGAEIGRKPRIVFGGLGLLCVLWRSDPDAAAAGVTDFPCQRRNAFEITAIRAAERAVTQRQHVDAQREHRDARLHLGEILAHGCIAHTSRPIVRAVIAGAFARAVAGAEAAKGRRPTEPALCVGAASPEAPHPERLAGSRIALVSHGAIELGAEIAKTFGVADEQDVGGLDPIA